MAGPPPEPLAMAGPTVVATVEQVRFGRKMIQGAQQSGAQVAPRKVHSTALQWLRDQHEHPPGRPTVPRVDITRDDPLEIGVLHRDTGMAYTFMENQS